MENSTEEASLKCITMSTRPHLPMETRIASPPHSHPMGVGSLTPDLIAPSNSTVYSRDTFSLGRCYGFMLIRRFMKGNQQWPQYPLQMYLPAKCAMLGRAWINVADGP